MRIQERKIEVPKISEEDSIQVECVKEEEYSNVREHRIMQSGSNSANFDFHIGIKNNEDQKGK